jgi:hypothetical protein
MTRIAPDYEPTSAETFRNPEARKRLLRAEQDAAADDDTDETEPVPDPAPAPEPEPEPEPDTDDVA